MWKLSFFIIILICYSCNETPNTKKLLELKKTNKKVQSIKHEAQNKTISEAPSKILENSKEKNIQVQNIKAELKKETDFDVIFFSKELKSFYRNSKLKKDTKELEFKELFKVIKDKVVAIQFYVNFKKFSSLPEVYRDKMNKKNTFFLSGIHIGDNYILTELNILKEASVIYIKGDNGINYLDLIGYDENYNIALLKASQEIKNQKIDPLEKDDETFLPGEVIFSLFSLSENNHSFRKHFIDFLHYSQFYEIVDALYSNTVSNIGNSGGIVFNSEGNFLGVISLYDSYYDNSGFIITNEIIKKILPQLKKGYHIKSNGWLGVYLREKNIEVFVKKVIDKSPAMKAGIKVGDKILEINKTKIKSKKNVKRVMTFINSGNIVNLKLMRNKKELNVVVKIIDKPLKYLYKNNKKKNLNKSKEIGIKLVKEEESIVVSEVKEGSLAFIYGIKIGDKLLEVSGDKVDSIQKYNTLIDNLEKNKSIRMKLLRGKEVKLVAFKKS